MKQRFSSLDVKVIAHELSKTLCTLRLANVYDLSSRIFLLKFAKPDNRQSLMIDSGFRCHLTDFTRATAATPSAFVARLRKFLRTRRVTSVSQIGTDRIIELQFSDGQYRLFFEFYAGGNIVLTDRDLNVLSLLRIVSEEKEQLRVGSKYSLESRQNYDGIPALTAERVREGLQKAVDKGDGTVAVPQKKSKSRGNLLKILATILNEFPPILLEHALRVVEFDPSTPVEEVLKNASLIDRLILALGEAQKVVEGTRSGVCKGYIIAKPARKSSVITQNEFENLAKEDLTYEDFQPFRPLKFEDNSVNTTILEFDTFNKTVDEFFSSIESQKLDLRLTQREQNAKRKLETARSDYEKRLGGLQQVQELNVRKAQAIETNLQKVQEAISAVNGLLAQGMDWMDVARLIEMEQEKHNVVAEMVKLPLKLYENTATLLLAEEKFDEEDDYHGDETNSDVSDSGDEEQTRAAKSVTLQKPADKRLAVDVDLALSPWSNARQYYDQKKSAAVKEQKTLRSSEKGLKSTERKITADLKKGLKQEKEVMRPQRKALWFEKFIYFISSEGYLILGGKDAQQAEILYKRHLKIGDIYIHADLHGAASIIVKNKPGLMNSPIPPSTLSQAGTLAVATSSAWDSKAVISAWWAKADQLSKTASTGDYLAPGTFTVRGPKTFLAPAQLLLGFGLMFKVSEESKARHLKHRVEKEGPTVSANIDSEDENLDDGVNDIANQTEIGGDESHSQNDDDALEKPIGMSELDRPEIDSEDDNENDSDFGSEQNNPLQPAHSRPLITQSQSHPLIGFDQTPDLGGRNVAASESSEKGVELEEEAKVQDDGETASSDDPSGAAPPNPELEGSTETSTPVTSARPNQADPKSRQPPVRRKRGKRNKLKTKYADQDEDDRALAMRLLGSVAAQEKASEDTIAEATKAQELAEQKKRRQKQHALAAEIGREAEEIRRLKFEEGIKTLDDGEVEELGDLDAFIGGPLPGDEILDALVMCGPWDAIGSRCHWKVKLQPGNTKKGKAVREILGKWVGTITDREKKRRPGSEEGNIALMEEEKVRNREGEFIKAIREAEVIGIVPVGKVRVVMGAGEAVAKGKGGGAGKGNRGGKGSKKQR